MWLAVAATGGAGVVADTVMQDDERIRLSVEDADRGTLAVRVAAWDAFLLDDLCPELRVDGKDLACVSCQVRRDSEKAMPTLEYDFAGAAVLSLRFERAEDYALRVTGALRDTSGSAAVLNDVRLLATQEGGDGARFGADMACVRVLEQGNYWGRVVGLLEEPSGTAPAQGEPAGQRRVAAHSSDFVSAIYDRAARMAFLAGFESSERWLGRIAMGPAGESGGCRWHIGFDGGDLLVSAGETIEFEPIVLLAGSDPWRLLEQYAEMVCQRHPVQLPPTPPVSWCSWYPYRLGVTEDRVLEDARIAAQRIGPLGLRIMELDLGWQTGQLPSTLGENDQFPHGLKWLSDQLAELGLELGVWTAPFSISEFDPVATEHPEWLIQDEAGNPVVHCEWFWIPHGKVYILDLTHPGAQDWLRVQMAGLHERGVKYLKADFIGCASDARAKRRHDQRVVAGAGTEAARMAAQIIRDALPDALLLNCGGPEMPGTGHWPLLYTCSDTGNTGFISTTFQQTNYQNVACHLFKNRRWGILQPSCLCVGLPGTVEDARLRATIAFLTGGQIDISDTLVTLPEDRWNILTATLPPLGVTAKPVDLFDPVYGSADYGYSASCADGAKGEENRKEHPPGSVWHAHVKADWDEWDLVGVFAYDDPASKGNPSVTRFSIPFTMLGLPPGQARSAFEFWSGQYLGTVPRKRTNPGGYAHPGDIQDLCVGESPEALDIAFFGPGAKLLCIRTLRPHPWVAGTTFHQSCGLELKRVAWDETTRTLCGEIDRPEGETGLVLFSDGGNPIASAEVDGQATPVRPAAHGAWSLPVTLHTPPARWCVRFGALP